MTTPIPTVLDPVEVAARPVPAFVAGHGLVLALAVAGPVMLLAGSVAGPDLGGSHAQVLTQVLRQVLGAPHPHLLRRP